MLLVEIHFDRRFVSFHFLSYLQDTGLPQRESACLSTQRMRIASNNQHLPNVPKQKRLSIQDLMQMHKSLFSNASISLYLWSWAH